LSNSQNLTWKVIKEVVDSKKHINDKINTIKDGYNIIDNSENPIKTSNLFNTFVTSIGKNLPNNITSSFDCIKQR